VYHLHVASLMSCSITEFSVTYIYYSVLIRDLQCFGLLNVVDDISATRDRMVADEKRMSVCVIGV
jgi:hypothetical protein